MLRDSDYRTDILSAPARRGSSSSFLLQCPDHMLIRAATTGQTFCRPSGSRCTHAGPCEMVCPFVGRSICRPRSRWPYKLPQRDRPLAEERTGQGQMPRKHEDNNKDRLMLLDD